MQCLEWGEIKKPAWQPIPISVRENGELVATALILKRRIPRSGKSIFYVPRGPVLDWSRRDVAEKLVTRLKETARKHRAIFIKIDPAVPASDPNIAATIQALGFRASPDAQGGFGGTQPRCVMKLDIAPSLDDVMAQFHQKWRYNIRLAERKGVIVRVGERSDLPAFHELYRITAERDGFTGRPLRYFEKLWDVLVERDMARLFLTEFEGQPLSGALSFVLPPQCWYVYGASSNEHRNLMPNHAMQWAMMQWAKERGCTVYDFRGVADEEQLQNAAAKGEEAASHLQGLNRFKAGFGAELVDYCGEWDLPLSSAWYWLWTTAKPRIAAAMKKKK
jgi:lipid II:glycine glycyltransferase (peptidoglycan interpeptide bridge formation enzyme)